MPDMVSERLITCFQTVFAGMDPSSIRLARQSDIAAWDSIAHVTLLSVIGEEFGIEMDFEDFESAISFPAILDFVQSRISHA
jgi:acyl carrier protein